MADAFALMEQAKWETEGTRRAIERYREAAAAADPATLPSGRKLLREAVPPLVVAITEAQAEAQGRIGEARAKPTWHWPILLLPSEALAVLVVTTTIRESEPGAGASRAGDCGAVREVSMEIARAAQDEVEFRRWSTEQVEAAKEAKETGDKDHVNLLARLRARHPTIHRNVWSRWRKRLDDLRREVWDPVTCGHFGAHLLHLLVTHTDHFTVSTRVLEGGRTQNYIRLSEAALETLRDVESRAEVARPQLMPMIMPPIPWRYEQ